MSNPWSISIHSWVLTDGNYADYLVGETRHFALEFYAKELSRTAVREKNAEQIGKCEYRIVAQVSYVDDEMWVLDFELQAYDGHYRSDESKTNDGVAGNKFVPNLRRGEFVEGIIYLSIDHYLYMEFLCAKERVPPLIYTWQIDSINKQCAPWLPRDERGVTRVDESKEEWVSVNSTLACPELATGTNELICTRLYDAPSSDGLSLARWDGTESGLFEGSQLDGRGKSQEEIEKTIARADLLICLAHPKSIDIGIDVAESNVQRSFLSRSQLEKFLEHETHRELLAIRVSEDCFYGGETPIYIESLGYKSVFVFRMDPNRSYELRRTEKLLSVQKRAIRWRIVKCGWDAAEFDIGIGSGSVWMTNLAEKFEATFADGQMINKEQLMKFLLQDSRREGLLVVLPFGMDLESNPFEFLKDEARYQKVVFVEKGNFNVSDYM